MAGGGSAGTREAPHPHQYKSKDVARYVHFNLDDVPETGNFLTDVSSMAFGFSESGAGGEGDFVTRAGVSKLVQVPYAGMPYSGRGRPTSPSARPSRTPSASAFNHDLADLPPNELFVRFEERRRVSERRDA